MLYASPDYTSPVRCGTCLPPPTLTPCGTEYDASRTPPTRRPPCARKHKFIILAASKDVCEGRERSMCLSTTVPQSSSVCGRYCQELLVGARGVFPQCLSNVWQKTPSDAQYRTCVNIFIKPSLSPAITSLKYLARYRQESGHAVISVLASSGGVPASCSSVCCLLHGQLVTLHSALKDSVIGPFVQFDASAQYEDIG